MLKTYDDLVFTVNADYQFTYVGYESADTYQEGGSAFDFSELEQTSEFSIWGKASLGLNNVDAEFSDQHGIRFSPEDSARQISFLDNCIIKKVENEENTSFAAIHLHHETDTSFTVYLELYLSRLMFEEVYRIFATGFHKLNIRLATSVREHERLHTLQYSHSSQPPPPNQFLIESWRNPGCSIDAFELVVSKTKSNSFRADVWWFRVGLLGFSVK